MKPVELFGITISAACLASVFFFGDEPTATARPSVEPQLQRGDIIGGEYVVSDPYLPCLNPSVTTKDCRTWEGYPRAHHGIDVAGGAIDTSSKRLTVPGVKGKSYRVTCHGDRHSSKGYGLWADIEIDGRIARWGHLSACHPGDLKAGSTFAVTGNTGYSTGPHIDYSMKVEGINVPPEAKYLKMSLTGEVLSATAGHDADVEALYRAIVEHESGGNSAAINPDSAAIGLGQVMPENVPSWTKECLNRAMTPQQFAADSLSQEKVVKCKLDQYLTIARGKYPGDLPTQVRCAAATWYSGQCRLMDSTRPQPYGNNTYLSIQAYTLAVREKFDRHRSTIASSEPPSTAPPPGQAFRKAAKILNALTNN